MSTTEPSDTPPTAGWSPPSAGLATSACVLGMTSLLLGPLLGLPIIVLGPTAIVVGIVALKQIRRGMAAGRARAIVGLTTGAGAIIMLGFIILWFGLLFPVEP